MRSITFLSHHVYESPRRAGFHALAKAFADLGWQVHFVTTGLSLLSLMKRDRRMAAVTWAHLGKGCHPEPNIYSYANFTLLHPFNGGKRDLFINEKLIRPLFERALTQQVRTACKKSELIVFESNASLIHLDQVRMIAPHAKLVYRVSDDLSVVGMSESILGAETRALQKFDLISSPSRILIERKFQSYAQAHYQPHGMPSEILQTDLINPYVNQARPIFTCVGSTLFDREFLKIAAQVRPNYQFHLVGDLPFAGENDLGNVFFHGEKPFKTALGHAAFTDVGLANYKIEKNQEYLAETSNKMLQYACFGKPILCPETIADKLAYPRVHSYLPGNSRSIAKALDQALTCTGRPLDPQNLPSWKDIACEILNRLSLRISPSHL